jgi:hypothetical protein
MAAILPSRLTGHGPLLRALCAVTDTNCGTLATKEDVDGFLVGGASLKGASFITICNAPLAAAAASTA